MDIVFKCLHGSHLFGTQNSNSDKDYKTIFCHDLDSLISNPNECDRSKNIDTNEETEFFSIKKYAVMLKQQQPVALEMLFSPPKNWIEFHGAWQILLNNKDKCVSKNILPFTGYAKEQARLYSEKGNSYTILSLVEEDLREFIKSLNQEVAKRIPASQYVMTINFTKLLRDNPTIFSSGIKYLNNNTKPVPYTMILNKQFENHIPITEWYDRISNLLLSFGSRTKKAALEGMDRKAMSSAVRIISEAIELCETGSLTFPRPEVELLREIRYNENFTYEKTSEIINNLHDKLLLDVVPKSKLWPDPDYTFIDKWYITEQKDSILNITQRY